MLLVLHNIMLHKKIFVLIFVLQMVFIANSQVTNFKNWYSLSYEQNIKLAKKFKIKANISQGFRISNIFYTPKYSLLSEIGVSKKITKYYKLGFSYRATYLNGFKNRIAINNKFSTKLKPFTFGVRLKYQIELEKNSPFSQDFRVKTNVKWNAHKDYKPYVFAELLYNDTYNFSNFNEYRLGLGLSADHKKKHNFEIMLMFVQAINIERPKKSIVLGLEYLFSK